MEDVTKIKPSRWGQLDCGPGEEVVRERPVLVVVPVGQLRGLVVGASIRLDLLRRQRSPRHGRRAVARPDGSSDYPPENVNIQEKGALVASDDSILSYNPKPWRPWFCL